MQPFSGEALLRNVLGGGSAAASAAASAALGPRTREEVSLVCSALNELFGMDDAAMRLKAWTWSNANIRENTVEWTKHAGKPEARARIVSLALRNPEVLPFLADAEFAAEFCVVVNTRGECPPPEVCTMAVMRMPASVTATLLARGMSPNITWHGFLVAMLVMEHGEMQEKAFLLVSHPAFKPPPASDERFWKALLMKTDHSVIKPALFAAARQAEGQAAIPCLGPALISVLCTWYGKGHIPALLMDGDRHGVISSRDKELFFVGIAKENMSYFCNSIHSIVRLLLADGVDPDAKDDAGRTAISYAVQHRNTRLVSMLLDAGASVVEAFGAEKPYVWSSTVAQLALRK